MKTYKLTNVKLSKKYNICFQNVVKWKQEKIGVSYLIPWVLSCRGFNSRSKHLWHLVKVLSRFPPPATSSVRVVWQLYLAGTSQPRASLPDAKGASGCDAWTGCRRTPPVASSPGLELFQLLRRPPKWQTVVLLQYILHPADNLTGTKLSSIQSTELASDEVKLAETCVSIQL